MDWNKLKQNKCPKCSSDLKWGNLTDEFFTCSNTLFCSFVISKKRFKEIVADKVNTKIEKHYRPKDENPELIK